MPVPQSGGRANTILRPFGPRLPDQRANKGRLGANRPKQMIPRVRDDQGQGIDNSKPSRRVKGCLDPPSVAASRPLGPGSSEHKHAPA
eukprot:1566873-Rhodomonas_salina.3